VKNSLIIFITGAGGYGDSWKAGHLTSRRKRVTIAFGLWQGRK
jgi:hypothetical protein